MTRILQTVGKYARPPTPAEMFPPPWNADLPSPIDTYDGSGATIHPSVVDMGTAGWNGYRYWLGDTPYGPASGDPMAGDNQTENPCIWASNTTAAFEVPAGVTNPLSPAPGPGVGFHSDTELVHNPDTDTMILFFRRAMSGADHIQIRALTSTDGAAWTDVGVVLEVPLTGGRLSPAVVREGVGSWSMWVWGDNETGSRYTATNPLGPWTGPTSLTLNGGVLAGWHGDTIKHDGRYLMAYSTPGKEAFHAAVSTDGIAFTRPANHVLMSARAGDWDTALYRISLSIPSDAAGVVDVWYSAITPATEHPRYTGSYTRIPLSAWT